MKSYWQLIDPPEAPALRESLDCDIAIVGAGYTGSWLAYWLRHSGRKIVVLEKEYPGFGASGRNGGLILQGPAELLGDAANDVGDEEALRWLSSTRLTFSWVAQLASHYDLDYRTTGSLYLGGDVGERPAIERTVALMQEANIAAKLLAPDDKPPSLKRLGYDLGAYFPDDGQIHPLKLIRALWEEARQAGIRVYGRSAVTGFDESDKGIELMVADNRRVRCQTLVVASNAYTKEWFPDWPLPIIPTRGQMLASTPIDSLGYHYPVYADHGFNYWHQRDDGRILVGGLRHLAPDDEVGTELTLHPLIQARLTDLLATIAGKSIPIDHRWSGIMAMTPDHRPYVGALRPRVWVAVGYNGHGSSVTPVAAHMLAEALLYGQPILSSMDVERVLSRE